MGYGYDALRELNPSVMVSSSLMGQTGPLAQFSGRRWTPGRSPAGHRRLLVGLASPVDDTENVVAGPGWHGHSGHGLCHATTATVGSAP